MLPFVIQGLVVGLLLFARSRRRQRVADCFLALLLLLYTLRICQWMLGFAGWYDIRDWHTTLMFYVPFSHWLAIGPLIYFYFLSATNADFKFRKRDWLHFIPELLWLLRGLFVFVMDLVVHHWATGEPLPYFDNTHGYFHENGIGLPPFFWAVLEYVSVFTYLVITLRLFRKYRTYLGNAFSYTEQINFTWLRNFIVANLAGHMIWLLFDIADFVQRQPLSYIQDWYSFFFLGILVYYLSISGYATQPVERQQAELHFDPGEEEDSTEAIEQGTNAEIEQLAGNLTRFMEEGKPYLDPSLNLTGLSRSMQTSPAMLSKTINSARKMNFNDFINKYRVQAVQEQLDSDDSRHLSLLAIALDCGFNSKATFNRAFKKHTGVSPSAYLRNKH